MKLKQLPFSIANPFLKNSLLKRVFQERANALSNDLVSNSYWSFLFLISLFWFNGAIGKRVIIDGTAALVGSSLITVQDARFYRALHAFIDGEKEPLELEDNEALKKTIQKMMFEEMVFQEMKSFKFGGSSRAEVIRHLQTQKKKGREKLWRSIMSVFSRSENVAVNRLLKSMEVERFIQKKVETLTPIITDAEVDRYLRHNQPKYKPEDFETIKPNVILLLKKQKVEKGLEEWVRFLKDKYGVTNYFEVEGIS